MPLTIFDILVFSAVILFIYRITSKNKLRLPPGPKPLPLVGNIYDLPSKHEWVVYRDWTRKYSKKYGTVLFF